PRSTSSKHADCGRAASSPTRCAMPTAALSPPPRRSRSACRRRTSRWTSTPHTSPEVERLDCRFYARLSDKPRNPIAKVASHRVLGPRGGRGTASKRATPRLALVEALDDQVYGPVYGEPVRECAGVGLGAFRIGRVRRGQCGHAILRRLWRCPHSVTAHFC